MIAFDTSRGAAGTLGAGAEAFSAAQDRLNRLLAEFRLFGGFGGPDGMRRWGLIQQAVREVERLRAEATGGGGAASAA